MAYDLAMRGLLEQGFGVRTTTGAITDSLYESLAMYADRIDRFQACLENDGDVLACIKDTVAAKVGESPAVTEYLKNFKELVAGRDESTVAVLLDQEGTWMDDPLVLASGFQADGLRAAVTRSVATSGRAAGVIELIAVKEWLTTVGMCVVVLTPGTLMRDFCRSVVAASRNDAVLLYNEGTRYSPVSRGAAFVFAAGALRELFSCAEGRPAVPLPAGLSSAGNSCYVATVVQLMRTVRSLEPGRFAAERAHATLMSFVDDDARPDFDAAAFRRVQEDFGFPPDGEQQDIHECMDRISAPCFDEAPLIVPHFLVAADVRDVLRTLPRDNYFGSPLDPHAVNVVRVNHSSVARVVDPETGDVLERDETFGERTSTFPWHGALTDPGFAVDVAGVAQCVQGVAIHVGERLTHGHHYFVRRSSDAAFPWIVCNDGAVTLATADAVRRKLGAGHTKVTALVLCPRGDRVLHGGAKQPTRVFAHLALLAVTVFAAVLSARA